MTGNSQNYQVRADPPALLRRLPAVPIRPVARRARAGAARPDRYFGQESVTDRARPAVEDSLVPVVPAVEDSLIPVVGDEG